MHGSSTAIAFNVTVIMMNMVMKVATTTTAKVMAVAMEVRPLLRSGSGSNRATALAWLSLVEYFRDNELAFFLFLVVCKS